MKNSNKRTKESDMGPIGNYEGVMNERFASLNTVTGSKIDVQ